MLMVKKWLGCFTKRNWKKTNQKDFRVEKVMRRKGDTLYVKWKGFNNCLTVG